MICPHCQRDTEEPVELPPHATLMSEIWFADFWNLFPRKVAKAAALKAWRKVATSEAVKDAIMLGLSQQIPMFRKNIEKDNRNYIPYPATWLNGKRWEDEMIRDKAGVTEIARVIACALCGDNGTISPPCEDPDRITFSRCSCARGARAGLMLGVYSLKTGERLGDAL